MQTDIQISAEFILSEKETHELKIEIESLAYLLTPEYTALWGLLKCINDLGLEFVGAEE